MIPRNIAVLGMYPHRASFEYALSALRVAGFEEMHISALVQERPVTKGHSHEESTKSPKDADTAADLEMIDGAILGWQAETRSLNIPGHGSFLISGPLSATLERFGPGGKVGGLTEALLELGLSESQATMYRGRINNGDFLLTVHCDDQDCVDKAEGSFRSTGAENISSARESAND